MIEMNATHNHVTIQTTTTKYIHFQCHQLLMVEQKDWLPFATNVSTKEIQNQ